MAYPQLVAVQNAPLLLDQRVDLLKVFVILQNSVLRTKQHVHLMFSHRVPHCVIQHKVFVIITNIGTPYHSYQYSPSSVPETVPLALLMYCCPWALHVLIMIHVLNKPTAQLLELAPVQMCIVLVYVVMASKQAQKTVISVKIMVNLVIAALPTANLNQDLCVDQLREHAVCDAP